MFAAMTDFGISPDLIISSCGGSIATAIINSFPNNKIRKEYLCSTELYDFIKKTKLTEESKLNRIGLFILKKMYSHKSAPFIEDVFSRYLVEMPQDLFEYLPNLSNNVNQHVRSIIIGAKLLFSPSDVNKVRNDRKLYRRIFFTDADTAQFIHLDSTATRNDGNYRMSAIDESTDIFTHFPMSRIVRISISVMFYVKPVLFENSYYSGGAIDLVPIEY